MAEAEMAVRAVTKLAHARAATGPVANAVPRLRIVFGPDMRIGPGKMDLLEAIGRTGSISAAGRELGMSYRRAWLLVDAVSKLFAQPVVIAAAGGAHGGGAQLTDYGRAVVAAYRRVEARTRAAIAEEFAAFEGDIVAVSGEPDP
jgi:molybdate transport system regulatory protein